MYNLKVKNYISGRRIVSFYEKPILEAEDRDKKTLKEKTSDDVPLLSEAERKELSLKSSLSRTKQKVHDIAFSNEWEYFITVTFNQKRVDRHSYDDIVKKYSQMLKNLKKRHLRGMEYVFVPERHKDGAYHFHGLVRGVDGLELIDSGIRDNRGRIVYNSPKFTLGFNYFTKVDNSLKCASYITKYLTKELMEDLEGRKKYWSTKQADKTLTFKYAVTTREQEKFYLELVHNEKTVSAKTVKIENPTYKNEVQILILNDAMDIL